MVSLSAPPSAFTGMLVKLVMASVPASDSIGTDVTCETGADQTTGPLSVTSTLLPLSCTLIVSLPDVPETGDNVALSVYCPMSAHVPLAPNVDVPRIAT